MMSRKTRLPFVALFIAVSLNVQSVLANDVASNVTTTTASLYCECCGHEVKVKGVVTTTVDPARRVIGTKGANEAKVAGLNTAEYKVTAKCEWTSLDCSNLRLVDPRWTIVVSPPTEDDIPPKSGEVVSWTFQVSSQSAMEVDLTFSVEVTYNLEDSDGEPLLDEAGENQVTVSFPGSVTAKLKIISTEITVYSYVGNMLTPPTAATPYYYAAVNEIWTIGIGSGSSTFGHGSFKIQGETPGISTFDWYDSKFVNTPCGYSISDDVFGYTSRAFLRQIRAYPATKVSPNADGYLKSGDTTGGTSKDFTTTILQTKSAVESAKSIHDAPPQYVLHSHNCVDVAIAIANAAGVDIKRGDCRHNVKLENTRTGDSAMGPMTLPDKLAAKLQ